MVKPDEKTPPATEGEGGAPGAESLLHLAREADFLDAAPESTAQASAQAGAAVMVESMQAELFGVLETIRSMTFPMLAMVVPRDRMDMLAATWSDDVLTRTSAAGAVVMQKHGLSMGGVWNDFGPYVLLGAALLPPVIATKRILTPPKKEAEKPVPQAAPSAAVEVPA